MGKGGDNVIGLKPFDFFASNVKRAGRLAGQGHLRAQILWHRIAVGFVLVIHIVAKRMAALVENHGNMGRGIGASIALQIPLQHVHKPADSANRQSVRLAGQRRQRMISTENIRRTINQMQMAPFAEFLCHVWPLRALWGSLSETRMRCQRLT